MSDFAKLLGNLKSTAKKASSTSPKNSTNEKKRERDSGASGSKLSSSSSSSSSSKRRKLVSRDDFKLPHDAKQLRVNLSFLGIGAQKSGTSWLHQMLSLHEDLSLPKQKEIHFWDWNRRKGLRWYSDQFSPKEGGVGRNTQMFGEITPCYAVLDEEKVCEIKYLFPNLKVIFIARDLVDRAWSALLMELRNSILGLDAGVFAKRNDESICPRELQRIERDSNPDRYDDQYFMDRLMHSTHSSRSNYAKSLRSWLKYFSKEQILILDYNDLSKKPRDLLHGVCAHLDIKSDVYCEIPDSAISERVNAAAGKTRHSIRTSLRTKMVSYLKPFAQDFNELLSELGYDWRLCDYST